jgi:hypothetical protein
MTIGTFFFPAGIAALGLGVLFMGWVVFSLICRERHAKITDAENAYWVRCGLVDPATAANLAQFEKGPGMKAIYAALGVTLLALGIIALLLDSRIRTKHPRTASPTQGPALSPTDKPGNSSP